MVVRFSPKALLVLVGVLGTTYGLAHDSWRSRDARAIAAFVKAESTEHGVWFVKDQAAWSPFMPGVMSSYPRLVQRYASDQWGRRYLVNPKLRAVASWGRDGKPGGTGEDADIVVYY